tara:strand:- start:88 stop:963 length:876 start_codon:yes stop_codon:yes gene_type:complete
MKDINIFCFGFGQVAKSFIKKLQSEKLNIKLSVTSRGKSESKKFENLNYNSYHFDGSKYDKDLVNKLNESDHILISIAPVDGMDIVTKNFKNLIEKKNLKWITYLSATSVYGNHNGEWVNEESETKPTSENGLSRLNAEKSWMELAKNKGLPIQIFRLSGIYSNARNVLLRIKSGEAKIVNKKNHFFSRIHVEDIANILFESLKRFKSKEIYNISDDKPASSEEVTLFGTKLLKTDRPKIIEFDEIESEMLKNFYRDSKKVSNKKMKNAFNYNLKYPTYIEGLNYIRNNLI